MKQRILAVDDEPHMLLLLDRIISEKTPYAITTLNNPLELPALLAREQFDLIITDLKMPGLDGLDILRKIRAENRFEQVVIVTAFGSLETAIEAMSQGVFDYITKPFKKEQILFTVERVMRWQEMKRQLKRLEAILEVEPYASAETAFRQEYVRRLASRCGGDASAVSARAGLPLDAVRVEVPSEGEKGR